MRTHLCILAAVFAATSMTAFSAQTQSTITTTVVLPIQSQAVRAVHGQFFGRDALDAAVLFSDRVTVFYAPAVHASHTDLGVGVTNDIAMLPAETPGVTPARMLTAGDNGLTVWTWQNPQGGNPGQFNSTVGNASAPWLDATRVVSLPKVGNHPARVAGIDSLGTNLLISEETALNVFAAPTSVAMGAPVLDICAVQWDGKDEYEIAVLTATKAYVIDSLGAPVKEYVIWGPGVICSIPTAAGSTEEGLVFVAKHPSFPTDLLGIVSRQHPTRAINLSSIGAVGVRPLLRKASDFYHSMVVSHTGADNLEYVHTDQSVQAANLNPIATMTEDVENWGTPANNQMSPTVADFDNDGDEDVLFVPALQDRVDLFRGSSNPNSALDLDMPSFAGVADAACNLTLTATFYDAATNFSHVEVTVWHQNRFNYLLRPTAWNPRTLIPRGAGDEFIVTVDTMRDTWFPKIFILEARLFNASTGEAGPAGLFAMGLTSPLESLLELMYSEEDSSAHGDNFFIYQPAGDPCDFSMPPTGSALLADDPLQQHPVYGSAPHEIIGGTANGGAGCLPDLAPASDDTVPDDSGSDGNSGG